MKEKDRFVRVYKQRMFNLVNIATEIWIDRETGVNYIFHMDGSSGGLTPLLDEEGKVVVTKNIKIED